MDIFKNAEWIVAPDAMNNHKDSYFEYTAVAYKDGYRSDYSKEQIHAATIGPDDMFTINETKIIDEINSINVMNLTPIEALQVLYDLQNKTKGM